MNHRTDLMRSPKFFKSILYRFRTAIIPLLLAFLQAFASGEEPKTNAPPHEAELWQALVGRFEREVSNLHIEVAAQRREIQELKSKQIAIPNIPASTTALLCVVLVLCTIYLGYRTHKEAECRVQEAQAKAPVETATLLLKAVTSAKEIKPASPKQAEELSAALKIILETIGTFASHIASRKNQ